MSNAETVADTSIASGAGTGYAVSAVVVDGHALVFASLLLGQGRSVTVLGPRAPSCGAFSFSLWLRQRPRTVRDANGSPAASVGRVRSE